MAPRTKKEHVIATGDGFFCTNCGREYTVTYPIEPYMFAAQATAFTKEHKTCKKTWTEPTLDPGTSSIEDRMELWLKGLHRGVSSETMFTTFSGKPLRAPHSFCHPLDPADFNRCHKLLELIPEWRERLAEMKSVSPVWEKLVDNWDKLTEMLKENIRLGKANGMYEFMQELGC